MNMVADLTLQDLQSDEINQVIGAGCCVIIEQNGLQGKWKPACSSTVIGQKFDQPNNQEGYDRCKNECLEQNKHPLLLAHCCKHVFFESDCKYVPAESLRDLIK